MRCWAVALAGWSLATALAQPSGVTHGVTSGAPVAPSPSQTWRLATVELPPSIGEALPNQGFYAVLLRRLLQEVGAVPAFEFLPPLRAYEQVVEGRVDGAFPYKKTPEREQLLWYSEPFYMARWRVFLAAQDPWTPQHTGELKDHGLGCAMQGSPVPDPLRDDAASGALRLQRVTLIDTCFRMLKLGRVRYVLTGENTGWAAVQALPDQSSGLRMAPLVVAEEGVYLTFPRKRPDSVARLQAFNEAVRKLRKSGELRRLEQAWMPRPPAP